MEPVAAWLVRRPQNAVLGLVATFVFFPPLGGAIAVLLLLQKGLQQAASMLVIGAALVALLQLLSGGPAIIAASSALVTWLPALLFGMALQRWRSLNLTIQASVVAAVLSIIAITVVLGDPAAFWANWLDTVAIPGFRESGLQEFADSIEGMRDVLAGQMTVSLVFGLWLAVVCDIFLGYALYQAVSGQAAVFGRFSDLGLGRVLALVMAVSSVAAVITGALWLQGIALMVFVAFWLQGLAILHWLRAEGRIPGGLLAAAYLMLPLLKGVPLFALAVAGYLDAWFGFRSRKAGP